MTRLYGLWTEPCTSRPGIIAAIPGIGPGIGTPGITGIAPGTGILPGITVHGIIAIPGIVPIIITGMARIIVGIPGTGTVGTLMDRASIMVLPVALTGLIGAGITLLMPVATAPVAVPSVTMSAA